MKKPWVIGALSILPGLGLFVLGEVGKGLGAFVLTALPLACIFAPWNTIAAIGVAVFVVMWVLQGCYAFVLAERRVRVETGTSLRGRQVPIAPLPPGSSLGEKSLHKARKIVEPHLTPGEQLLVALPAAVVLRSDSSLLRELIMSLLTSTPWGEMTGMVYLGVTKHDLMLVSLDLGAYGEPSDFRRIPLSKITSVQSKQSLLDDNIIIDIEDGEPLRLRMYRHIREATRQLVEILSGGEQVATEAERSLRLDQRYDAGRSTTTPSTTAWQGFLASHPILGSALLGAGGGIGGTLVSPILAAGLAATLGYVLAEPGQRAGFAEGLGILMGGYCLLMFPVGGAILGAVPGIIVGVLRNSRSKRPSLFASLLAGFLAVVIPTLAAVAALLTTFR